MIRSQSPQIALRLLVVLLLLLHPSSRAQSAPPIDSYADAVDPLTGGLVSNPQDALGAPDGIMTSVVGILGQNLILDMGAGEEGTGDLTIHYGDLSVSVTILLEFLDSTYHVIEHSPPVLLSPSIGSTSTTVAYTSAPIPYRFVRFFSAVSVYKIDAIQTATHCPDSDNDGLPDDWELSNGLDPLNPTGNNGASGDLDSDGLTNSQEYTRGTNPKDADSDDDGLSDGNEVTRGTNPLSGDSDNDTLPDGWEVQYHLDPLNPTGNNGANGDPDQDGRTNRQEYLAGTNPTIAEFFTSLPLIIR